MTTPTLGPKTPSDALLPDRPAAWFKKKFPKLAEKYGEPIHEETEQGGRVSIRNFSEDFFAASLGFEGTPEKPTVYLPTENRFFSYSPDDGVFSECRESDLETKLSQLFLECARACQTGADVTPLEFRFRDSRRLSGIIKKAKSILAQAPGFFSENSNDFLVLKNGVLRLSDRQLLPFDPKYKKRNKIPVEYNPGAQCPLFMDTLMRPAIAEDDIDLLQRYCGMALTGVNAAQKIMLLTGTAGGGKGTFIRTLSEIIGKKNLASLRTEQLTERFEISRMLGKTLLYGADVPEDFLNSRGASILKALTGGDPMTVEFKNSNEAPEIICRFNVIVTCNSRLIVRLEGDIEAWRRRVVIIPYLNPPAKVKIADLSERIIQEEGPGVLNWMLEGRDKISVANWNLALNERQQKIVDDLLLESDSVAVFVAECLERAQVDCLTVTDCHEAYTEFCFQRGWTALPKNRFGKVVCDEIARKFALSERHDVSDATGKKQRGWKGLRLRPVL